MLLAVSQHLPRVRGAGVLARLIQRFYLRRARPYVLAHVNGAQMALGPSDYLEGEFLFLPQLYDARELAYLSRRVRPGETFLDVGSHIGFYALYMSRVVGARGRVLAIEADPDNCRRLHYHLGLNGIANVTVEERGVADRTQVLKLSRNESGNTGGHSFLYPLDGSIEVRCAPLLEILLTHHVEGVAAAKIDIEGMEYRVLDRFFADAPRALWPRALVIEFYQHWVDLAGGDVLELLRSRGYRSVRQHGANHFLDLQSAL